MRQVEGTRSVNSNAGNIFIKSSAEILKHFPKQPSVSRKMVLSGESQRQTRVVVRALFDLFFDFDLLFFFRP